MFARRTQWHGTPNRWSQALEEHRRRGLPLLDLTESNPTRCGFSYDERGILAALSDPSSLTYEPDPHGLLVARRAVADYYGERGVKVDPRQVFLTTSTSEAYSYLFRLLADPGDNVLTPSPSYPLFDFLLRLNDLEQVSYPLIYDDEWQIDLHALESRITPRTRGILVVHPNNPTGSFVHAHELDALIQLCRRHSLALIADEVFADYAWPTEGGGARSSAEDSLVPSHAATGRALTFTLSGLSKISALPQIKLAWIVASGPADLLGDALSRLEFIADTYLSVAAPLAHALPKLLAGRHELQEQIMNRVQLNVRWLDGQFSHNSLVRRLNGSGGWYAILKLPAIRTDEDWAIELLEKRNVLMHPGHFFDFHSDGHLVASLLPTPEVFQKGITGLMELVSQNQGP